MAAKGQAWDATYNYTASKFMTKWYIKLSIISGSLFLFLLCTLIYHKVFVGQECTFL